MRSFEEDALLKRPPPDFALGQEHWLGLHVEVQEKLWLRHRLVNPTPITEAEECTRMMEAIYRARKELAEKKAKEVFEDSKLAEPQRLAAPPPTNAETSRTEVSAWVGSTSERRRAARWTPQPRGLRAKKLVAFRVGEGVPFSDCYPSFRNVVRDAKRNGQFAANFNIIQSIVSVLMRQQYPTLYGITFPRKTPNRYFLDEAQMWKVLGLLRRNVTRSLPPRSDTEHVGLVGEARQVLTRVLQKLASKTFSKQIFHRGRHQWRYGVRCITSEMTVPSTRRYLHGFPTPKPSQLRSGSSLNNV